MHLNFYQLSFEGKEAAPGAKIEEDWKLEKRNHGPQQKRDPHLEDCQKQFSLQSGEQKIFDEKP